MTAASQSMWATVGDQLDVPSLGGEAGRAPIQQRRRRGFDAQAADGRAAVRLLRDDGLLRWVYEPPVRQLGTQGRRSWRAFSPESRETVQRIAFPELGANQLTDALRNLDRRLNPVLTGFKAPSEGLRRWNGQAWAPLAAAELAALKGRVLVLVHGTFSASAMYAKEFTATVDGETLLQRLADASGTYKAVLAFDHPTLSVAPWLNALALRDALAPCPAEFDFVGHSRGGLVISWLLRMAPELRARQALFVGSPLAGTSLAAPDKLRQALDTLALRDALAPCPAEFDFVGHSRGGLVISWLLRMAPELRARQALFVGSPLAGTSLAAPDKLRQALDTLASFADAVSEVSFKAGKAAPPGLQVLALGVGGLACVLGKVLELGARTPLVDAAVGLVPGLLAQGRVNNNLELAQLYPLPAGTEVRAIGGSFMPAEVNEPLWKLWKRVTNLKGQAMYYGADLIFDQPNDLVVDSASMNKLGDLTLAAPQWEDLGVSAQTHHTNYFQDLRVLTWLDGRLR